MSIVHVSMTSLQSLIDVEKFYHRDFTVSKGFNLPNDNTVCSATVRIFINGMEAENFATKMGKVVLEDITPSSMDDYEEALHNQRLSYSMSLSTSKHVYSAYHTVR